MKRIPRTPLHIPESCLPLTCVRCIRTRLRTDSASGEEGVALITVVLLSALMSAAGLWMFQDAIHSSNATSTAQKQLDTRNAAEAGINAAIQAIGSATSPSLPCGTGALNGTLATNPAASSYAVNISYYSTFPASGNPIDCGSIASGSALPASALIDSSGTSSTSAYGNDALETLVQMTQAPGGGFGDAIFSQGSLIFNNNATLNGEPGYGSNFGVYSNSNINCNNNTTTHGTITDYGSYTINNNCQTDRDVYTTGNVIIANNVAMGGSVKSSQGSITVDNGASIAGDAIAHGTVTLDNNAVVQGAVVQNAVLPDPPYQAFPTLTFNPAAWTAAGYTTQITDNDCNSHDVSNVYNDIANMATALSPTVIQTSCDLQWNNNTTITLNANLAIFSTGGYSANNNFTVQASGNTTENMFFVVPSGTSCSGGNGQISFNNNASITPPVQVFLYSPCNITVDNNQTTVGQIYGGSQVTINNNFTMTFEPLASAAISGVGAPTVYATSIVYTREIPAS